MPDLNRIPVPIVLIKLPKAWRYFVAQANAFPALAQIRIKYRKLPLEKLDLNRKKQEFVSWLAGMIVGTNNEKNRIICVESI